MIEIIDAWITNCYSSCMPEDFYENLLALSKCGASYIDILMHVDDLICI